MHLEFLTNMELKISFLDQMSRLDIFEDSRSRKKDRRRAAFFMFIAFNTTFISLSPLELHLYFKRHFMNWIRRVAQNPTINLSEVEAAPLNKELFTDFLLQ